MLTIPEAAQRVGRTEDALRKAIRKGTLKAIRRGDYLIDAEEVDRYKRETQTGRPKKQRHPAEGKEAGE